MNEFLELKVILLGESGVGKTSIISRYINDTFSRDEKPSIAMNFSSKIITRNNFKIRLNIWDTIGQEKLRSLSNVFLNNAKIVILVYNILSIESFECLDYWLELYKNRLSDDTILGVAGNKQDLFLEQKVPDEDGSAYAKKNGAIFALISAKNNKAGLDKFMDQLVDAYLLKNSSKKPEVQKYIKLEKGQLENKSGGGCCGGKGKKSKNKYNNIIKKNNGILNCVFLGENGVGKTSIMKRICGKKFNQMEKHTEELTENLIISEETNLRLNIYDVNNDKIKSKEFVDIIKKVNIFFLVYDVHNMKTLKQLRYWIDIVKNCKEEDTSYLLFIIGNKEDEDILDKQNNDEELQKFSSEFNAIFRIASAKEDKGLENLVGDAIESYLNLP